MSTLDVIWRSRSITSTNGKLRACRVDTRGVNVDAMQLLCSIFMKLIKLRPHDRNNANICVVETHLAKQFVIQLIIQTNMNALRTALQYAIGNFRLSKDFIATKYVQLAKLRAFYTFSCLPIFGYCI